MATLELKQKQLGNEHNTIGTATKFSLPVKMDR